MEVIIAQDFDVENAKNTIQELEDAILPIIKELFNTIKKFIIDIQEWFSFVRINNSSRVFYLAFHSKSWRVRKKNLKRLQV